MNIHEEVIAFINRFTNNGKRQEVIECFTCGCCYWFALMLDVRFWPDCNDNTIVMYDQVTNHFGCEIQGRVYDITGDVTDEYFWKPWSVVCMQDPLLEKRITRDCIEMRDYYEEFMLECNQI